MTRMLAFVAALLLTAITVSSACVANGPTPLRFTIEPAASGNQLEVRFKRNDAHGTDSWSSTFPGTDLTGLDLAALRAPGNSPLRFAIIRDAGRVDCSGNGANSMATGICTMTADQNFNALLAANGIARPSDSDTYGMIALGVRRDLVLAISRANYPAPTPQKLIELSAVEVTPAYIEELSGRGYRPKSLNELVEFAALKITPAFIASFANAGYGNLAADDLVQLKALDITPDYVAGFRRLGYRDLPVSTLVQLKALDITPEFVRAVQQGDTLPSPDHLVQIRAVSRDIRNR